MRRRQTRTMRLAFAAAGVALVAGACGGGSTQASGGTDLSGNIRISGSSTVEPISSLVAAQFQGANPSLSISVDGPGTTDGFALFSDGKTQISDASRPLDAAEEVPTCKKNGVEFVELKIGIDGLTVMTNPANGDVDCLDFKDLYALLGPPLDVVGPGEESGTWGSFVGR